MDNLVRTYKGNPAGIVVYFEGGSCIHRRKRILRILGNGVVPGCFSKTGKIPKNVRNCSVKSWGVGDSIVLTCDIAPKVPDKLTVANLCGTCTNKDIFVSINGAEQKHIYSVHPTKDSQVIRRWWIDASQVLHIRTWPWHVQS